MNRNFGSVLLGSALALFLAGCISSSQPAVEKGKASSHEHDHAAEGPHHGHLIELGGGKYHAELVHTETDHNVTVYLLDESTKNPVATSATELKLNLVVDGKPEMFSLPATPAEGEEAGRASKFSAVDEKLCGLLHGDVKGRVNVMIDDKEFVGDLTHDDHDHGDHQH